MPLHAFGEFALGGLLVPVVPGHGPVVFGPEASLQAPAVLRAPATQGQDGRHDEDGRHDHDQSDDQAC